MAIKMTKFGGSSMADATQFAKVRAIIEADKARQFAVPSAPGKRFPGDDKITDLLYLCHAQQAEGVPFYDTFDTIAERYVEIERALGLSTHIEAELNAVRKNLENGASEDYIASRGEHLNALLLADYLGFEFMDAAELICFHSDGTYDDETTQNGRNGSRGARGWSSPAFTAASATAASRRFRAAGRISPAQSSRAPSTPTCTKTGRTCPAS